MSKESNTKGLWKKLKIVKGKDNRINLSVEGQLTSLQLQNLAHYQGQEVQLHEQDKDHQEDILELKHILKTKMTESKEYEDIESKEKSKNRKKSGDSFHNQFSQSSNEPMILSLLKGKHFQINDPRFEILRQQVKRLKKQKSNLLSFIQYKHQRYKQLIDTFKRDFQFKMKSQQEEISNQESVTPVNQREMSLIPTEQQFAIMKMQRQNGLISSLEKEIQRQEQKTLKYRNITKQLQQKVNRLQQQNENLNEMVFDYGQKIALLDLETDKKHEESIQQIAEKKQKKDIKNEEYLKQIKQLENEIQVISSKYLEGQVKMNVIIEMEQNIRIKEKQLSIKQYNLSKLGSELQARAAQLQGQILRIKERQAGLQAYESSLLKRYNPTTIHNNFNKVPHTNSIVQYPQRPVRLNLSPKNTQAYNYQSQSGGMNKHPMRSVSPSYRYKGFNKKQFDLASNRSKEREKVFTSRTRVYPMKTDKKLSDVNTKLEKLRHQIRKQLNEIK